MSVRRLGATVNQRYDRRENMKFDYGDSVQLAGTLRPCEVVGITAVESAQQADTLNVPIGTVLYTVEFGDGSDALVPETALEAFTPR